MCLEREASDKKEYSCTSMCYIPPISDHLSKTAFFPSQITTVEPLVDEHRLVSDRYIKSLEYRGPLNA